MIILGHLDCWLGGREGGRGGREEGNDSHVVISVYVSKECVTLKTAAATDNNINS